MTGLPMVANNLYVDVVNKCPTCNRKPTDRYVPASRCHTFTCCLFQAGSDIGRGHARVNWNILTRPYWEAQKSTTSTAGGGSDSPPATTLG